MNSAYLQKKKNTFRLYVRPIKWFEVHLPWDKKSSGVIIMSQGGWRHPLYFRWAMSSFTNNTQQEGAFFLRRITQNIFYNITKIVRCMCEWNQCNTKSRTTKSWNTIFDSQCLMTSKQVEKLCERYVLGTMLVTWTERGRRWKHCHDATRWYSGRFYCILCTCTSKLF